jgi:hypothetical protein
MDKHQSCRECYISPPCAHFVVQAEVIGSSAILDAQRRAEFIGLLPCTNDCHIHCDQLRDLRWDARGRAVTNLLIIGYEEINASRGT